MDNIVRPPDVSELAELWTWLKAEGHAQMYQFDETDWHDQFYIAVFDRYVTGSPGFSGRVLYLIWNGGVEQIDVFICRHGQTIHVGRHHEECEGLFRC